MKKKLIIFGNTEFAVRMYYCFRDYYNYDIVGFCVDQEYKKSNELEYLPVYNTDYVIENNTGEFIENRLFSTKTRGKFIQLSEELPKGYFILQDQEVTDSGEIIVSDNSKLYLWKEKETNKKNMECT